jgi:hypothetical protein
VGTQAGIGGSVLGKQLESFLVAFLYWFWEFLEIFTGFLAQYEAIQSPIPKFDIKST